MDKIVEFEKLLTTLNTEYVSVDDMNKRNAIFLETFENLPPDFDETIIAWIENFLSNLREEDEDSPYNPEHFYFLLILEGLETRNKTLAFRYAKEALLHDIADSNEAYVYTLTRLNFPETAAVLIEGLKKIKSFDYLGGYAQVLAINYLTDHRVEEAYSVILHCLSDEADRVRLDALSYISVLDKKEALPKLIEMLKDEDEDKKIKNKIEWILEKWNLQNLAD